MSVGSASYLVPGYKGLDLGPGIIKLIRKPVKDFFKKQDLRWIARYGPGPGYKLKVLLTTPNYPGMWDLSMDEAKFLREECKLSILPVSRPPTSTLGSGTYAGDKFASWAELMGIPKKVHLWCDFEGKGPPKVVVEDCQKYINDWAAAVKKKGYPTGLYLAQSLPLGLTGKRLDELTGVTAFWKSGNTGIPQPTKGFSILQQYSNIRGNSTTLKWKDSSGKSFKRVFYWGPDLAIASRYGPTMLWGP